MADLYRSYLDLLVSFQENLAQLTDLARVKVLVVQNDDLLALDELLKQEQAISLSFRGLDLKREKMLAEMGAADLPLSSLPQIYPAAMQAEAQEAVEQLQEQFHTYRHEADKARGTLEGNIRRVEKILEELGVDPAEPGGPGYASPESETPPNMKTDFRA